MTAICTLITSASVAQQRWSKTFGGASDEDGYSVDQTQDGGYIATGRSASFGNLVQLYLIKTDASGDTLWTRTYGGADNEYGRSVQQTSDGGYVVAGWTGSFENGDQVYLIKTNASGDTLWTQDYGGANGDYSYSVQQTSDAGYIVAGRTASFGNQYQVHLIKTDANGSTGVEETPSSEVRTTNVPTIVRGVLFLTVSIPPSLPVSLLDVSCLSPGVYFATENGSWNVLRARKVVVAR